MPEFSETTCLICLDDYGDLAEECLISQVCEDCHDEYQEPELMLKKLLENENE